MSINSEFFNFYKELENSTTNSPVDSKAQSKILEIVKKNLRTIAVLSKENHDNGHLSFAKNGEIVLDNLAGRPFRSALKKHIVQYSSYSEDKRDLVKFTQFVAKFMKTHIDEIDLQQTLVLKTMLQQSLNGLERLRQESKQGGSDLDIRIPTSIKKLNKALSVVEEKTSKGSGSIQENFQNYTDLLRDNISLGTGEKIVLLQKKLEDLRMPNIREPADLEENQATITNFEIELEKTNNEIEDLLSRKQDDLSKAQLQKALDRKQEIQTDPSYILAKEKVTPYQPLRDLHQEQWNAIFADPPNSEYKLFVDSLKIIYPNSKDQSYLLANLLLVNPSMEELRNLEEKLQSIAGSSKMSSNVKIISRNIIEKNGIFEGALNVIKSRKKQKSLLAEKDTELEYAGWKIGRATANFIAAGGIATLAFIFPYTSFSLTYVPSFLKAGKEELSAAWNQKSVEEQHEIAADLKKMVKQIQENPITASKAIVQEYKDRGEKGEKVIEMTHQLVELNKNNSNFAQTIKSMLS